MSRKEMQFLQLKRMKHVLKYVYDRVPFYKKRFDEGKVKPSDLRRLEDLRKFPFTTKDDLRQHGVPYGILAVPRARLINFQMSSGTTGRATIYPYTRRDIELWANVMARQLVCCGVRPGDIMVNCYGYHLFTGGPGTHLGAQRLGVAVIPWGAQRTEALVEALRERRATVIAGTPSFLYHVTEVMKGVDPERDFDLRVALCGAEPWTPAMRARLNERFALRSRGGGARDYYGTSEMIGPGAGSECFVEQGIHFWTDHFYLEVVDRETGEPLPPGEEGELVFTHLSREAAPLIRFRQGDVTKVLDDGCECGRVFPRIAAIKGRADDMIIYKGAKFYPSQIEAVLLKFPEAAQEYQIVVDKTGATPLVTVRVETDRADEGLEDRVRSAFLNELLVRPEVEFVKQGDLPRFEGKAKRVVVKQ
ncbi:MAG: phenylacetate--CoA ligase [Thaumarchaeota archaeon]|nr:phenylacetate--CoA ligase [Nitrososphaerota archaeon]